MSGIGSQVRQKRQMRDNRRRRFWLKHPHSVLVYCVHSQRDVLPPSVTLFKDSCASLKTELQQSLTKSGFFNDKWPNSMGMGWQHLVWQRSVFQLSKEL